MIPGKRKLAGETLREAFTPLQPLPSNKNAGKVANRTNFQFNFTEAV